MKRSESVLVYAVTAVLAVILVVAVVFGNEGAAKSREGVDGASALGDLQGALDGRVGDKAPPLAGPGVRNLVDPTRSGPKSEVDGPGGTAAPDPLDPSQSGRPSQYGEAIGPLRADPRMTSLAAALGPFRAETQFDGIRYRVVEVQRGDTFSDLLLRWTASANTASTVLSLNEWIDPISRALRAGDEVRMPWVDDAELLSAWQVRRDAHRTPVDPDPAVATVPGREPRTAPTTPGESYEVKKGETLWVIAERKVGRRAAPSYIDAIVAANASIGSADSVKAGQRIILPAIE